MILFFEGDRVNVYSTVGGVLKFFIYVLLFYFLIIFYGNYCYIYCIGVRWEFRRGKLFFKFVSDSIGVFINLNSMFFLLDWFIKWNYVFFNGVIFKFLEKYVCKNI